MQPRSQRMSQYTIIGNISQWNKHFTENTARYLCFQHEKNSTKSATLKTLKSIQFYNSCALVHCIQINSISRYNMQMASLLCINIPYVSVLEVALSPWREVRTQLQATPLEWWSHTAQKSILVGPALYSLAWWQLWSTFLPQCSQHSINQLVGHSCSHPTTILVVGTIMLWHDWYTCKINTELYIKLYTVPQFSRLSI
jgi:hypothetical protein